MSWWQRIDKGPVRWGIIGAGNIAKNAVAPAILQSNNGELLAVSSRSIERANHLKEELGAQRAYGSYAELLADAGIDAVYIGLPNGLHEEWTIASARAGKHVLCEKSLTFTVESGTRMEQACRQARVLLMDAYMYRHHPQWGIVHELLPAIGEIRSVTTVFTGTLGNEKDHRWSKKLGGGPLYDVTCYGINACRYVLGKEPRLVTALLDDSTPDGVDRVSHVTMLFPGGVPATAVGSLSAAGDQSFRVAGTHGIIHVEKPFIPGHDSVRITLNTGDGLEEHWADGANHYLLEVEHFGNCLLNSSQDLAPAETGVHNVAVCEAAWLSWREGRTVAL